MNIKHFKNMFIFIIIFLILTGIYIIYIKDNLGSEGVQAGNKKNKITKEIIIGITEFDTLNPIKTKSLEMQHLTKLIYEPLIDITQDFNTKPVIAEEFSKIDNLTYIIKLNENKKWQNGENVKFEDIEYTINTIKESDSVYKENVEEIEKIEKISENTFKIYLNKEVSFFEYLLCFPIIKANDVDGKIGTGQYKLHTVSGDTIVLQNEGSKIEIKIHESVAELYNAFSKEKIDLMITQNINYEEYIGKIGYNETIIPGREFYYILCENIEDAEERKQINQYINKEKLIYDLYNKKYIVADSPLGYGSYLNKSKEKEYKENKIKQKTYTLSNKIENKEIAEKIKEQLEEKGIKINILNYETEKADLILKQKTMSITPNLNEILKNEEIKKIEKIENKEILKEEYSKILETYYEEAPFISLYFNSYIILRNNKLKGDFTGNWYNFFYNIETWYVNHV